ncbi:unnamed protein product [Alternaria alternata]
MYGPLPAEIAASLLSSSGASTKYLDELDELPDGGKKERIEKRKRMLEALEYFGTEMCQFRLDVLNDHKKRDAVSKHR